MSNERTVLRVAAYAVCVVDDHILLARWVARDGGRHWTLPGGGMEHGEDPYETVMREVTEETGHTVRPLALLGLHSVVSPRTRALGRDGAFHGLRVFYEARITGGELRSETGGSTDLAAWHPLAGLAALDHVDLVDEGLALWRERPADGHRPPTHERP